MTRDLLRYLLLMAVMLIGGASVDAAEYFVSKQGNDAHNGLSREAAFATIQKGVDALKPGDTLTIAPGEYRESVRRDGLGSLDARTLIRAEIPGTVILRGDVPVTGFRPVEGYRFVYVADFVSQTPVPAVNELDTLKVLNNQPNVVLLEISPGSFHHDAAAGKLYVSATTLNAATEHAYSASVIATHGLYLSKAKQVVIEGLAATGFNNLALLHYREGTLGSVFGIFLFNGKSCVVRNCLAWLNGSGIGLNSADSAAGDNVVEGCTAWANDPQFNNGDLGGLSIHMARRDMIRDSTSFANSGYGVNIYATGTDGGAYGEWDVPGNDDANKSRLVNNVAWGNSAADVKIKTGVKYFHTVERCAAPGNWSVMPTNVHQSLKNKQEHDSEQALAQGNINLADFPDADLNAAFADPVNHDYRLQSTSPFRGVGAGGADLGPYPYEANIFYVRTDGDDAADGLSVGTAWRSLDRALKQLPAGATLYISGGSYALPAKIDLPARITLRGRGSDKVILQGAGTIAADEQLTLERLTFSSPVTLKQMSSPSASYCTFNSLRVEGVEGLRLSHATFIGGKLELIQSAGLYLAGTVFDSQGDVRGEPSVVQDSDSTVLFSDYNVYDDGRDSWLVDGRALDLAGLQTRHDRHSRLMRGLNPAEVLASGPHGASLMGQRESERRLIGPFIHSVTDTTANIEWWTTAPTDLTAVWGEVSQAADGADADVMPHKASIQAHRFGTFSLKGLKPGTTYRFKLIAQAMPDQGQTLTFTTAKAAAQAKVYHVAPDGDDTRSGLSRDHAWRTVSHAASRARPGDTVLIAGGTYHEAVRLRATGDEGQPITIKAAPGEKAQFDGMGRTLDYAFYASDKHHLHFDGLYFTGYSGIGADEMPWSAENLNAVSGTFVLYRADGIQISRCFSDGRGPGYAPGVAIAVHCRDLRIRNCVIINAMGGGGLSFYGCPDLHVENSVFLVNLISNIGEGANEPDQPFYLHRNIFTDNLAKKVAAGLFSVGKVEAMVEADNVYFLRVPDQEKRMWHFYDPEAYARCAAAYHLRTSFDQPPAITKLTRMSQAEYASRFHPESRSLIADPIFAATVGAKPLDRRGEPVYLPDFLLSKENLDFPDLFATNSEVVKRGIGLQPEAFVDFHFNRSAAKGSN